MSHLYKILIYKKRIIKRLSSRTIMKEKQYHALK